MDKLGVPRSLRRLNLLIAKTPEWYHHELIKHLPALRQALKDMYESTEGGAVYSDKRVRQQYAAAVQAAGLRSGVLREIERQWAQPPWLAPIYIGFPTSTDGFGDTSNGPRPASA